MLKPTSAFILNSFEYFSFHTIWLLEYNLTILIPIETQTTKSHYKDLFCPINSIFLAKILDFTTFLAENRTILEKSQFFCVLNPSKRLETLQCFV